LGVVEAFEKDILKLVTLLQDKMTVLLDRASKDILCELDCYNIATGIGEVGGGLCKDLLGKIMGTSLALWLLSLFLQAAAVAAAVLCVRFKKKKYKIEKADSENSSDNSSDSDSDDTGQLLTKIYTIRKRCRKMFLSCRRG